MSDDGRGTSVTCSNQLRFRQVAEEKLVTYQNQRKAADKECELRQAEVIAVAQGDLTRSSVEIRIAENKGSAQLAVRQRDADCVRVNAAAARVNTSRTRLLEFWLGKFPNAIA